MRSPFFHGVGGVLSADIAVPGHERELGFCSEVVTTRAVWLLSPPVDDFAESPRRGRERGG
jgi:hypothetical protein